MINFNVGICLLGNSTVGKSSFLNRIEFKNFNYDTIATVGVDYGCKEYILTKNKNYNIKWKIWDIAGQACFRNIVKSFFKSGLFYILFFDVTNYYSFLDLEIWLNFIKEYNYPKLYIVGTKIDKIKRTISREKAEMFAICNNATYFEISNKTEEGISSLIDQINNDIISYSENKEILKVEKIKNGIYPNKEKKVCCNIL